MEKSVNRIRKISILLFLVPTVAIIFALFFHNLLVSFKFVADDNAIDFSKYKLPLTVDCNIDNNFCLSVTSETFGSNMKLKSRDKFEECSKNIVEFYYLINDKEKIFEKNDFDNKYLFSKKYSPEQLLKLNIKKYYYATDEINSKCILNSRFNIFYELVPGVFNIIYKIKTSEKYIPGTNHSVNPFFYGESSISNIVKRFPINFFFKPLLYLTTLLMLLYWLGYNNLFNLLEKNNKKRKFFYFGICSSFFLLIHVFLLGKSFDNEIFDKLRRLPILLFIFSEIFAQIFLVRSLYIGYSKISQIIHKFFLKLKIYLVVIVFIVTLITFLILSLLLISIENKIINVLEWNYFLILLLFFLFSFLMLKKRN